MSQFDPAPVAPPMPIPVQPLGYSLYAHQVRPGIITAIGVMCIVVACLSGIASLVTGMYGFGGYMLSKLPSRMPTSSVTVAAPTSASSSTPSLSPADAAVATNALTRTLALNGKQVRELSNLLRNNGRDVLGGDENVPVSSPFVTDQVQNIQHQPDGSVSFDTAQGHVDLFDDHSHFNSSDGSQTTDLSAANGSNSYTQNHTSVAFSATPSSSGSAGAALTPAEIQKAVAAAQQSAIKLSSRSLTPAQLAALNSQLSSPNQQLVTPGSSVSVMSASVQPNGNAIITFNTGSMLVLGPQGQVISSGAFRMPKVSLATAMTLMGEAGASILLAIYLLVIGIVVFRSYRGTAKLLRIYAVLKIPLAIAAGIGIGRFGYELTSSSLLASSGMGSAFYVWGVVLAIVGIAFPIGLLIALSTRGVRNYYNSVVG